MSKSYLVKGYTPELTENLSDGDCYFSAIFRALEYHKLLDKIFECLKIPIDSEKEFIKSLRRLVAAAVKNGAASTTYDSYKENFNNEIETLKLQIESTPEYIQGFLKQKIQEKEKSRKPNKVAFYTYDEFAKELSKNIKQHNVWAGQLEVLIVKNILELCNVIIDFYSSNKGGEPPKRLPYNIDDKYYIYLYNSREIHWKHYKLIGEPKDIRLKRLSGNITYSRWNTNNTRKNNVINMTKNNNTRNHTNKMNINNGSNTNSSNYNSSDDENIKKIIKLIKKI